MTDLVAGSWSSSGGQPVGPGHQPAVDRLTGQALSPAGQRGLLGRPKAGFDVAQVGRAFVRRVAVSSSGQARRRLAALEIWCSASRSRANVTVPVVARSGAGWSQSIPPR